MTFLVIVERNARIVGSDNFLQAAGNDARLGDGEENPDLVPPRRKRVQDRGKIFEKKRVTKDKEKGLLRHWPPTIRH